MIAVNLEGGLGNQLFQIAFGYSLSVKFSKELYLTGDVHPFFSNVDLNSFNRNSFKVLDLNRINLFNKKKRVFDFKKLNFYKYQIFEEVGFDYNDIDINFTNPTLFKGYWQSEKYFSKFQKQIRLLFSVSPQLDDISRYYLKDILISNSVAIHVRRGDYISVPENYEKHGVCGIDYYKSAIEYLSGRFSELTFFVFTDDHDWVKENMLFSFENLIIVSTNNIGVDSWRDLYLISKCKHQIIANSTFSWWGAWLNNYTNKEIIAPLKWFSHKELNNSTGDLIPSCWTRL